MYYLILIHPIFSTQLLNNNLWGVVGVCFEGPPLAGLGDAAVAGELIQLFCEGMVCGSTGVFHPGAQPPTGTLLVQSALGPKPAVTIPAAPSAAVHQPIAPSDVVPVSNHSLFLKKSIS